MEIYEIKPPVNKKQCLLEGRGTRKTLPWCEDIPKRVQDGCCISKTRSCKGWDGNKGAGGLKGLTPVKGFYVNLMASDKRTPSPKTGFQVCSRESSSFEKYPMPPPGEWKKCADEGKPCICPNGRVRLVQKGFTAEQQRQANPRVSDEPVTEQIDCKPENFMKGDPTGGKPKECLCTTCVGPIGTPIYIGYAKCTHYVRDPSDPRYFDAGKEWTPSAIQQEFAPVAEGGTAKNRDTTNCADWIGDMSKCGWYHKLFRSLQWPQGKIFPCFSTAYMLAQGIAETNGNNCAAMIFNGILEKSGASSKNFGPEATLFMKSMRHLDVDIITNVATLVLYYAMEQCTERYKVMRMVLGLTMMFGKLITNILPAPLNTVGSMITKAMDIAMDLLKPVNYAVDGFYELRMKIFEPIDTLAHIMSDVTAFADITLKIASMNKYTKTFVELVLKKSHINKLFAILTKFTMLAIKLVFENPVVKAVGQAPMKLCQAAMKTLSESIVWKKVVKAGKGIQSAFSKKFTVMGQTYSVQWILRKLTDMLDLVMSKIQALLDPILKPLEDLFNKKVLPLITAVLKKLGFPAGMLPSGKSPGFMKKDAVLGPGCYIRIFEPCVGEHKWKVRAWNRVTGTDADGADATKCIGELQTKWKEKCKVEKVVAKFVSGKANKDPPVNPFLLWYTCAFNIDYFMTSGVNKCHCCIMGMMNPKKPIASLLLFAFKSKICKLMRPSKGPLSKIELSPIPQTCWSPSGAERLKLEAAALAKLDQASQEESDADKKDLGPAPSEKGLITPDLKKQEKKVEAKFASGPPKETQPSEAEKKEADKEETEMAHGGASAECADEGGECACRGTVFFGRKFVSGNSEQTNLLTIKKSVFVSKGVQGSIKCTTESFGSEDPAEGDAKHCICEAQSPGQKEREDQAMKAKETETLEKSGVDISMVRNEPTGEGPTVDPAEEAKMAKKGGIIQDPKTPIDKIAFMKGYSTGQQAGIEYCKSGNKNKGSVESVLDSAAEVYAKQAGQELGEENNGVSKAAFVHGFNEAVSACAGGEER